MAGEKLHDYDLTLCDHALGNVRYYLKKHPHQPSFVRWLKSQFSPGILRYVRAREEEDDPEWLLLNDDEFDNLQQAVNSRQDLLFRAWVPYEPLYERYVHCVKEIRDELTKQSAEDWARACVRFAKRLKDERLGVAEGIEIVHEWVRYARRLLLAMGATVLLPRPEGTFPTPTNPTPSSAAPSPGASPPACVAADQLEEDMAIMKRLIAEHGDRARAPAKGLIKHAGIRHKRARNALRRLEALGEYEGFARKRPDRYQKRSTDHG